MPFGASSPGRPASTGGRSGSMAGRLRRSAAAAVLAFAVDTGRDVEVTEMLDPSEATTHWGGRARGR